MIIVSKKIFTVLLLAGAFFAHSGGALAGPSNPATSQSGQTAAPDLWKN